ncbi:MAG: SOS response-associated peptidase [Cyclobacteriaceae bacterium]
MCDRYSITVSSDIIKRIFGVKDVDGFQPTYNAGPTQELAVLLSSQPDTIQQMTWGLISKWSNNKSISPKLFNLPVQQAFEKKMYQRGLKENRCVVLADGFFLWKQIGKAKRVPYYFYQSEQKPFGIAALWESYEDMDGNPSNTFIMLTCPASTQVEAYQEDMPLILTGETLKQWLNHESEIDENPDLYLNSKIEKLKFHPVSPLISSLDNDHADLIKATLPSDQHGNYTLFN